MLLKLRRGFGSVSAWVALFAVAGVAYAARRRTPQRVVAETPSQATGGDAASELSPLAE